MSFESSPIESVDRGPEFEKKKIMVAVDIQSEIMRLVCSPEDGQECFIQWTQDNGAKFIEVFERAVKADPKMLDKWDSQRDFYIDAFLGELGETPLVPRRRAA